MRNIKFGSNLSGIKVADPVPVIMASVKQKRMELAKQNRYYTNFTNILFKIWEII